MDRKRNVVVLTRVSTIAQELERQADLKNRIIESFRLHQILHKQLKFSGTVVAKTTEYKQAMTAVNTPKCDGMIVPELDRWFRLKMDLLSEWGKALAAYVEPFEVLNPDGKTAKLIYTTLTGQDGELEFVALDLRKNKDQTTLLEAVRYATKERAVIAGRFERGKEGARLNPEIKVDTLPYGVEFVPYSNQPLTDANGRRKTRIKGYFRYNEYALRVVKPTARVKHFETPSMGIY